MVGFDLSKFLDQGRVIDVKSSKSGQCLGCSLPSATLDIISRSLGQDQHPNGQDDGPGELYCDRDTVRTGIVTVLGGVVNNGGDEETDSNRKLIAADNSTADPFGSRL